MSLESSNVQMKWTTTNASMHTNKHIHKPAKYSGHLGHGLCLSVSDLLFNISVTVYDAFQTLLIKTSQWFLQTHRPNTSSKKKPSLSFKFMKSCSNTSLLTNTRKHKGIRSQHAYQCYSRERARDITYSPLSPPLWSNSLIFSRGSS